MRFVVVAATDVDIGRAVGKEQNKKIVEKKSSLRTYVRPYRMSGGCEMSQLQTWSPRHNRSQDFRQSQN